jgi:hypothetical protein
MREAVWYRMKTIQRDEFNFQKQSTHSKVSTLWFYSISNTFYQNQGLITAQDRDKSSKDESHAISLQHQCNKRAFPLRDAQSAMLVEARLSFIGVTYSFCGSRIKFSIRIVIRNRFARARYTYSFFELLGFCLSDGILPEAVNRCYARISDLDYEGFQWSRSLFFLLASIKLSAADDALITRKKPRRR